MRKRKRKNNLDYKLYNMNHIDNCCEPCMKQNKKSCDCNILGAGEVTVTRPDEGTIQIHAPHNNTISSNDNSVVLTESTNDNGSKNTDLSVTCCDKLVAVCDNDNKPGTLADKIQVSDILTKDVDCSDNGTITIGIDTSEIPDEKVAIDSEHKPKYLKDLIRGEDGIHVNQDGGELVVSMDKKKFVRPFAKRYNTKEIIYTIPRNHGLNSGQDIDGNGAPWLFPPFESYVDNNRDGHENWLSDGGIKAGGERLGGPSGLGIIEINKTGYYRVDLKMEVWMKGGIVSLRCIAAANKRLLVDCKTEPSDGNKWCTDHFTGSTIVKLKKGEIVYTAMRVDVRCDEHKRKIIKGEGDHYPLGPVTVIDEYHENAIVKIRQSGFPYLGNVGGETNDVSDDGESGSYVSVEWVSQENGDMVYENY